MVQNKKWFLSNVKQSSYLVAKMQTGGEGERVIYIQTKLVFKNATKLKIRDPPGNFVRKALTPPPPPLPSKNLSFTLL
jgi:hypothetical protein